MLGFLAGIAYEGYGDPLAGTDLFAVTAWIDNYCSAHPLDSITQAAEAFDRAHPGPAQ